MEKVMPRGTVAALMSDTPEAERQQIYAQLEGRAPLKLKILLVTPELLDKNARVAAALARLVRAGLLSLFAVDESHTVTDWGTRPPCTLAAAASDASAPQGARSGRVTGSCTYRSTAWHCRDGLR